MVDRVIYQLVLTPGISLWVQTMLTGRPTPRRRLPEQNELKWFCRLFVSPCFVLAFFGLTDLLLMYYFFSLILCFYEVLVHVCVCVFLVNLKEFWFV